VACILLHSLWIKRSMGSNSWILLQDSEPAFIMGSCCPACEEGSGRVLSGSTARLVLHGVSCGAATNQCLHIFQGAQWLSSWEVGRACCSSCGPDGVWLWSSTSRLPLSAGVLAVEQYVTAAIKCRCTGCSLHHQQTIGAVVRGLMRSYIPWWCRWRNELKSEAARQRASQRKMNVVPHQ
jgi:hypothetical protein